MKSQKLPLLPLLFLMTLTRSAGAGDVRGEIRMPSTCSPEISPAVVWLEPVDGAKRPSNTIQSTNPANSTSDLVLVQQAALQFKPRVLVLKKGQKVRFTNEDSEFHNVHVQARGELFNQTMPPGQPAVFTPSTTGILHVLCDIHHHMRAFLVVQDTPWVAAISPKGKFRLDGVPAGQYRMSIWHESGGKPLVKTIDVPADGLTLDTITLADSVAPSRSSLLTSTRTLTWPEVIDRISTRLSAAIAAAERSGQEKRARTLSEDAYWVDFESNDMETAVRAHLGLDRAIALEKHFLKFMSQIRDSTKGSSQSVSDASKTMRTLISLLVQASDELKSKGITDNSKVLTNSSGQLSTAPSSSAASDQQVLEAISKDFRKLSQIANADQPEDAASFVTTIYFGSFEPFEQQYVLSYPMQVARIESQFSDLRARLRDGLKGEPLEVAIADLNSQISQLTEKSESRSTGTFAGGFFASLVTILREGIEVILLLTILSGLVTKVGIPAARKALYTGVFLAVIASLLTAFGINTLVASSRAQTRELLEGVVMLAASGILFYVSYWLIAQSQTKKWIDFLKNATRKGLEGKGFATIGLTAFLAIYREGAETALMYQALLTNQTSRGVYGILTGLGLGLVSLAVLALLIRYASLKLPIQKFFKYTGMILFSLSVIFAGKGVFELQSAAIMKTTTLGFPWPTIPDLGIYPNLQVFLIQAILLGGALASILVLRLENRQQVMASSTNGSSRHSSSTVHKEETSTTDHSKQNELIDNGSLDSVSSESAEPMKPVAVSSH